MMGHERKCGRCGSIAIHARNVFPEVLCHKCGSDHTRPTLRPILGPKPVADFDGNELVPRLDDGEIVMDIDDIIIIRRLFDRRKLELRELAIGMDDRLTPVLERERAATEKAMLAVEKMYLASNKESEYVR